jgi:hypothetical protein
MMRLSSCLLVSVFEFWVFHPVNAFRSLALRSSEGVETLE